MKTAARLKEPGIITVSGEVSASASGMSVLSGSCWEISARGGSRFGRACGRMRFVRRFLRRSVACECVRRGAGMKAAMVGRCG